MTLSHRVLVRKPFIAQHYLIGGDWGAENFPHSHPYILELELAGAALDQHNYLVDIDHIKACLDDQLSRYSDKLLNDLPEFSGQNPSIELFSRVLCQNLSRCITAENIHQITVRLWERDDAWASFTLER